jgi:hypothetical protein
MAYPTHGPEYHERDPWKLPCRAATTATITIATALNAGDTLDGVTLAAGDRVLVKNQSTASQNGIWIVGASPARATDFDSEQDIVGAVLVVSEGTTNADTVWLSTTNAPITVGTTALSFVAIGVDSITAHLADTTDAHDASAISFTPAGTIAATDVQAAIEEVASEAGGGGGAGGWETWGVDGTQLEAGRSYIGDETGDAFITLASSIELTAEEPNSGVYLTPGSNVVVFITQGYGLLLPSQTADPGSAEGDGQIFYRSDTDEFRVRANGAWGNAEVRRGSGTATITSGNTSVTVTHGAGYTPGVSDVTVTPTNSPTNDPGHWWISSVGATTFVINVRANPGASGASFAWRVAH